MKLSVSTLTCPAWELDQLLPALKDTGIQGIDFRGLGGQIDATLAAAFTTDLDKTLARLKRRRLSIPCFATSVTLVSPGPQRWQDMLDEAHRYAELARRCGTPYLRIFGGRPTEDLTEEQARLMAGRHLRQVIKLCKAHQVLPLVETHDAWCTSQEIRALLHEFDPSEVGVLWDVEHPFRKGEPPAETAVGLKKYIRHIHIKDSKSADGQHVPTLLGEGNLPLAEAMESLKRLEYGGWLCLETEKRWHRETAPEPEASIPAFVKFVRAWGA